MSRPGEEAGPVLEAPEVRPDGPCTPCADRRSERIAEYLATALDADCPLVANLGVVNADLMHLQQFLRQVIDDALNQAVRSLAELEFVMPGIDNLMTISKQIDRFTQLEMKVKAAQTLRKRSGSPRRSFFHRNLTAEAKKQGFDTHGLLGYNACPTARACVVSRNIVASSW